MPINIITAIEHLRDGLRVYREPWQAKIYLVMVGGTIYRYRSGQQSETLMAVDIWMPSQIDVMASDWAIYTGEVKRDVQEQGD